MVWILGAVSLAAVGVSIAMAVWVSSLKDRLFQEEVEHTQTKGRYSEMRMRATQRRAELATLRLTLRRLRKRHESLVRQLEAGPGGGAAVDELRRLFDGTHQV